jgi:nucleotide-binding universal stress UspA family protein
MFAPKKILVPTDFSEPAEVAFQYAKDIAKQNNSTLVIVHTVEVPIYPGNITTMGDELMATRKVLFERSDAALGEIAQKLTSEGFKVETKTLYGSNPADEIVGFAQVNRVDLICIATHGRSGWKHLMLGSIAERVLRKALCPVLTVRRSGDE